MVDQKALAPLVRAEESTSSQERAYKGRLHSPIEATTYALLSPDGVVCVAHGGVLWRHMWIALLSRFYSIQRVHEHIASCASYPARQYCLQCSINYVR